MDNFERRLIAAYKAWHVGRGRVPEHFFALYADDIELHSILDASLAAETGGPFVGKPAAIAYFAMIAERWEMIEGSLDKVVARGNTLVCIGRAAWRNLKTLRVIDGPKVDVWTVRDGCAIRYLEMFDSHGYARAMGLVDPSEPTGGPG
jgi:ketosteroid isomerase-like protein